MNRLTAILCCLCFALSLIGAPKVQPPRLVFQGEDGRLQYDVDERGNRVPDFSNCGYAGANVAIPSAPVRLVVKPIPGDVTERIQRALDYVGQLPADSKGIRGAVLLLKGRHEVLGTLYLTNSGVVLRGQGVGPGGTMLVAAGTDRRTLIRVLGRANRNEEFKNGWTVADEYVPVGARSLRLDDATGLKPGDAIHITRPSNQEWIDHLGATEFGGGEGDWRLTWKPGSRDLVWDRTIVSRDGNRVTIDAPITTALESRFGGGRVERYAWPGRIRQVGIENLQLESAVDPDRPKDENHSWCGITMENTHDAWVRQVTFRHFAGSAVAVYESCKQVTVQDCVSIEPVSEKGGYRRHTFFTMGQLVLFMRCYAERGRHDFSVGHCAAGPNAFVQCEASLPFRDSGPIESWSSGVLFDGVRIDGNGLSLAYRGPAPNGAGWSAANSVLWNCSASLIRCQNPPSAQNWAFGSWAEFEGNGIWRQSNEFASPGSLYAAQLRDRLGNSAIERLELMPRTQGASSNPSLEQAQKLAAAAHGPAPLLSNYILNAHQRDPILCHPGEAREIEDIVMNPVSTTSSNSSIVITNGWITVNGKLLIGGKLGLQWWRGNIRPKDAPAFNHALTRFVPGRFGRGLTDVLDDVVDSMTSDHRVALDHNYGLWYDRRRDDHQHVRRNTGDSWPPFYEQPFARSGRGTAWDGLSQYDLTRFNPWYWSRLKAFADRCDQSGLLLFHQNYFQHNLLEAGAHWADSSWRSTNNINGTGFPEPPPYAGDKRIFMAELFYDVTHPVRRKLHEGYIRQCLNAFTNNANVIQFTSAEYTGPQHFVEFWLDTVAQWESETRNRSLVALSTTKDTQDAVLADRARNGLIDVIDFRYWWRTQKGEFAPPGGKNLAPRQFERRWRGGRPKDSDLASMALEYRTKFPDKALIANWESAAWAWLCAGGSIPRLPSTTDESLLRAIPRMMPWVAASDGGRWALREPHGGMLLYTGGKTELELPDVRGSFEVRMIDPSSGRVRSAGVVKVVGKIRLPTSPLIWLSR